MKQKHCRGCPHLNFNAMTDEMYCKLKDFELIRLRWHKQRPDWCPLVEVKEPHGDLIDKDKLMQEIIDRDLDHLQRDDWKEVIQIVSDADVVIEAEGSET